MKKGKRLKATRIDAGKRRKRAHMLKSYLYSTQKRMLCAIADGNAKQKTREKTRANDFVVPSSYTYFPTS